MPERHLTIMDSASPEVRWPIIGAWISAAIDLVVPVRYTHAHNGIMNRRDFDQMVELVVAMLKKLDAAEVRRIRDFAPEGR